MFSWLPLKGLSFPLKFKYWKEAASVRNRYSRVCRFLRPRVFDAVQLCKHLRDAPTLHHSVINYLGAISVMACPDFIFHSLFLLLILFPLFPSLSLVFFLFLSFSHLLPFSHCAFIISTPLCGGHLFLTPFCFFLSWFVYD